MSRVLADTYYWIALLNDRDQGHAAATAISQTLGTATIVTTQEVLSEVLTYFCEHGRQVRQAVDGSERSFRIYRTSPSRRTTCWRSTRP